jgi:hypothetical protein
MVQCADDPGEEADDEPAEEPGEEPVAPVGDVGHQAHYCTGVYNDAPAAVAVAA